MNRAPLIAQRLETVRRSARFERLRARSPRYAFIATTAILAVIGLRDLVTPDSPPQRSPSAPIDHASEQFAEHFARVYLAYDPRRPRARERALRVLVPEDLSFDAGREPRQAERVLWTEVAQNQEALAGGRVIVLAVGVSSQSEPLYLAVPVHRRGDGAVGLTGYPSLVGPPTISRAEFAEREEVQDAALVAVARRVIANYLARERANLNADLAPGAEVSLPTLELALRSVEDVVWADGAGSTAVLATVVARDTQRSAWTLTYELGVEQRAGRAYVTFVETVPTAP